MFQSHSSAPRSQAERREGSIIRDHVLYCTSRLVNENGIRQLTSSERRINVGGSEDGRELSLPRAPSPFPS